MSELYKTCPRCWTEHKLKQPKCGCGYEWAAEKDTQLDPYYGCCAYVAFGERCHYPGTHTHSTTGTDKWYCRHHAFDIDGREGAMIVTRSHHEIPNPDYSHDAIKRRCDIEHEKKIPPHLKGWNKDEYIAYAKNSFAEAIRKVKP